LWEVYSDKYVLETEFTYTMTVIVDGPNFTDEPVIYSTAAPIKVPVAKGRINHVPQLHVPLPAAPADKVATISDYVNRAVAATT
jgi:hypothetical protein